jgi:LysM repeat protein
MAIEIINGEIVRSGEDEMAFTPEQLIQPNTSIQEGTTITDFETNPLVVQKFEKVMDYLQEKQGLGDAFIDPAGLVGSDDIAETMRDFENRLGTKIAAIKNLEDAPKDVKDDLNYLLQNWQKASPEGVGEWAESIYENAADMLINPETFATLASAMVTAPGGGVGGIATKTAAAAAKRKATKKLYDVLQLGRAATEKNPYKAVAAVSAVHGGVDDLLRQDLEITTGAREERDLGQTAATAAITGAFGASIVGGGAYLSKGYKALRKETDMPNSAKTKNTDDERYDEVKQLDFFDEDTDEKIITALDKPRLSDDAETGTQGTLFDIEDTEEPVVQEVTKFVSGLGGGEQTTKKVLSQIRAAANKETTKGGKRSAVRQVLYKTAANLTADFYGKTAGVLTPFTAVSGTAKQLQKKMHSEFGTSFKTQEAVVEKDLFEVQREVTGRYNEAFRGIVDELSLNNFNTKFADDVNAALSLSLRSTKPINHENFDAAMNKTINRAATQVRELYQEMGIRLKDIGTIKELNENYVPRMWSRSAIERSPEKLERLFVEKAGMTSKVAKSTVKNMLNKNEQIDAGSGSGHFFSAKRKINEIANDADFEEFLNSDVLASLHAYTFQAGKQIAKHRVLGVTNFKQFEKFYINRIKKEVEKAGEVFTAKDAKKLEQLYRTQTGEGLDRFGSKVQTAADAYSLVNRVAYLGLATLSSLTEVMLNISKGGVRNSVKGLGEAINMSHKKVTGDLESILKDKHGLTANEAFAEMRDFSIHVDQEMSQLGDRLTGDALINENMQKVSNKFFRVNMLDQWTRFVQSVSFRTGKNLIQNNIEELAKYGDNALDKRGRELAGELAELGVDYNKGVNWFNNGSKLDDSFYKENYLAGAARYTNSVILQPTGLAGNKPFLMANPKTSILFQLLSYPAAFSNTVLKGMAKQAVKSPVRGGVGRIVPAALLMTGMARWTNYLRTNGQSEEKDTDEVLYNAIARWGGNGLLIDSVNRARTAAMYTGNAASYLALPFGPIASDAMSLYQQGIIPTLGNKVPVLSGSYFGKNILGDFQVRQYRAGLKEKQSELSDALIPDFEGQSVGVGAVQKFNLGGIAKKAGGTLIDVLSAKTKTADENAKTFVNPLHEATEGLIKNDELSKMSRIIEQSYAEELNPEEMLSGEDFAEALIVHNIKRKDISIDDIDAMPKLKNALESKELTEAREKFADARRELAVDDDHAYALDTIAELREDVDSKNTMANSIGLATNQLRNLYRRLKVDLSTEDLDKVAKANYDSETIESLHDFLTSRVKSNPIVGKFISEGGAERISRDLLFKIAARGNVDLTKFKPPKTINPEDAPGTPLSVEQQSEAIDKFLEGSKVTTRIFRARKSYGDKEFFMSFAMPRELGTHMGNEGAADNIRLRDIIFDNWNGDEAKDLYLLNKNQLTKEETFEVYKKIMEKALKEKGSTTKFDDYIIEEGVVNIKNPLVYKSTMTEKDTAENVAGTWDAVEIFSTENGIDEVVDNLKAANVKVSAELANELSSFESRSIKIDQMENKSPLEQLEYELMRVELNLDVQNMFKKLGFDGIEYQNRIEKGYIDGDDISYIAFDPEQFKTIDSTGFDSKDKRHKYMAGSIAKKVAKVFVPKKPSGLYSQLSKEAAQLSNKPKSGTELVNRLKNKLSVEEEVEWTGLENTFAGQKNVTRDDIVSYLDEADFDFDVYVGRPDPVKNEEYQLRGRPGTAEDDIPTDAAEELGDDADTDLFLNWWDETDPDEFNMANELLDYGDEESSRLFDELFDVKMKEYMKGSKGDFVSSPMHQEMSFNGFDSKNYREIVLSLNDKFKKIETPFTGSHHAQIDNVLLHIRLSDIEATKGSPKTLLLDEVQSDAHQQAGGKSKNYAYTDDEAAENMPYDENKIPILPFKEDKRWGLLGLKKAMITAADEGYDQIALTTGRMQALRNNKNIEAGEGKKFLDFYDKTLIKLLKNNFGKKYNSEIKMVEYDQQGEKVMLPTMEITSEMRKDINKGLQMFSKGGYVVESGDTLSEIAQRENLSVSEIADINNIKDVNKIYVGQTLRLKPKAEEAIALKAKQVETAEPVADKPKENILTAVSGVQADVTESITETFDEAKEFVTSKASKTLSSLKKMLGADFSSKGRTAENTAGTTETPKLLDLSVDTDKIREAVKTDAPDLSNVKLPDVKKFLMGDMTMEQLREANTPDAPDLSDTKLPDLDFSSEGRTRENTAGSTAVPELSMPSIEFKPKGVEELTEKQLEDQETLVDTLKGLYKASRTQVAKNLIAFFNPLAGDKTEDDYNPQVIEALAFAARNALLKGKRTIDYGDYNLKESNVRAQVGSSEQRNRDNLEARMKSGDITPTEEAAFSVGGGGVLVDDDKVYVTDTYDFSKLERQISSVVPDEYAKLREWISNYKGNEFKSKIFVGTLKDLGL